MIAKILTIDGVVDIPYNIITNLKLEKWLLSSTISFKAPGLMSPTRWVGRTWESTYTLV